MDKIDLILKTTIDKSQELLPDSRRETFDQFKESNPEAYYATKNMLINAYNAGIEDSAEAVKIASVNCVASSEGVRCYRSCHVSDKQSILKLKIQ